MKTRLKQRAQRKGRSMEEEVRDILRNAAKDENRPPPRLGSRFAARFASVGRLDRQPAESIWITSVTLFESRLGLRLLPAGRRRDALERAFAGLLEEDLENRILDFDTGAAMIAAELAAQRTIVGRPVDIRDTQIAGIALARRAALATRNTRHFADLKVSVIDPWRPHEG